MIASKFRTATGHACAGALAALLLGTITPARAAEVSPCDGATATPVSIGQVTDRKLGAVSHLWGKENVSLQPGDAATRGEVARVAFPAGSFSPGRSPIRGGLGFEYRAAAHGTKTACLTYKVRFPAGFDFVQGGKLPGLFGGDDPRGCVADDKVTGFSARLMWRTAGAGELYLYAPGRDTRCGQSLGRAAWTFQPGAWTNVAQKVVMNTPGAANGSVEVWIDGKSAVKADGLTLGSLPDASVDGVLFATFFGGGDPSWATPRDQAIDFADVTLWSGRS